MVDTTENEEYIKHECFRENLYVYAHLPKAEFNKILEQFKSDYPHFVSNKKKLPLAISWSQFRKHIKSFFN